MANAKQNLMEAYSRQVKIAEAYAAKKGFEVNDNIKLTTAVLMDNTNRFISMREGFNTQATERSNLGDYKKFCLNLVNLSTPTLIANDLVIVHPMTSFSGSVAYLEYQTRTKKGDMDRGTLLNGVFGLGPVNDARTNYTAQVIIETITTAGGKVALTPMHNGRFTDTTGATKDVKVVAANGTVAYYDVDDTVTPHVITGYTAAANDKVAYFSEEFQMEHVPAQDIPTIGPVMKRIPLVAEPRRIAVKYDQISAFEAKTDYGFNLDKQIAEQAVGELNFEIDCEIINILYKAAKEGTNPTTELPELTWSKTQPIGVSKFEHYNGFLEVIEAAKAIIYERTNRFEPSYMVVAPKVMKVLKFVNGFTAAKNPKKNGPYKAGDLDGMGVYVTPQLKNGEFFFGLNGSDMMSSVAVYAPYMPIVPTMLLGTPDGGLAQGFSTWYATATLNTNLAVYGQIVD